MRTRWGAGLFGLVAGVLWWPATHAADPAPLARITAAAPALRASPQAPAVQHGRIAIELESPGADSALTQWLQHHDPQSQLISDWHTQRWRLLERIDGSDFSEQVFAEIMNVPGVRYVAPVFSDALGGEMVPTSTLLVSFDALISDRAARSILREAGLAAHTAQRNYASLHNVYRISHAAQSGRQLLAIADVLADDPRVRYAEPDWIFSGVRSEIDPNDPFFDACWGLHNTGQNGACQSVAGVSGVDIDALEAWEITIGSEDVIVVVIDDGVQLNHPDLNTGAQLGENFTGDLPVGTSPGWPVSECDVHGTAVAGIVAARLNNAAGGVGAAPGVIVASARAHPSTPACDGSFTVQASWVVNALDWAQQIGARVTNTSATYGFSPNIIIDKFHATHEAGIVHVASSGNDGGDTVGFPANIAVVNAVGSIDPNGAVSGFSNTGSELAFVAPGSSLLTTDRTGSAGYVSGSYVCIGGTSFAAPHVAAVAALMCSVTPSLDAPTIDALLAASAQDLNTPGFDEQTGHGLVNARAALEFAISAASADDCADAATVESGEATFGTLLATEGGPTPPLCSSSRNSGLFDNDVWFEHFAECTGRTTISVCGDGTFAPALAVYDDVPCDVLAGAQLACTTSTLGCAAPASIELMVTQGQRIIIRVGGVSSSDAGIGLLMIECQELCPGDATGDGTVDLADLLAVIAAWGSGDVSADLNEDGLVNLPDLLEVIAHWSTDC